MEISPALRALVIGFIALPHQMQSENL